MRLLLPLSILLLATVANAQNPVPEGVVNGVDYRFEKLFVQRRVDDEFDRGTIRLATYVYTPLRSANGHVALVLHGSTGGQAIDPGEPVSQRSPWLGYLIGRGYTVVIASRRGRGESEGRYVEECAYQPRRCSLADNRQEAERALADALASTDAVVAQVIRSRLKTGRGRLSLWGSSRGGFLALSYARRVPELAGSVVAVSPGWLSISPRWGEEENASRLALQERLLAAAAGGRAPVLWIDGDADPYYASSVTEGLYASFLKAGGRATRKLVAGGRHGPDLPAWRAEVDALLARAEVDSLQTRE